MKRPAAVLASVMAGFMAGFVVGVGFTLWKQAEPEHNNPW